MVFIAQIYLNEILLLIVHSHVAAVRERFIFMDGNAGSLWINEMLKKESLKWIDNFFSNYCGYNSLKTNDRSRSFCFL